MTTATKEESDRVYLNGHIDIPADRYDVVMAALPVHIQLTLSEPGCVSFNVTPSDSIKGRLMVSETFVNQQAFDFHQQRTRTSDWFRITENIPREYSIRIGSSQAADPSD